MWNADFDIPTVHNRLVRLGQDPAEFFCPSDFAYKSVYYKLDTKNGDPSDKSSLYLMSSYTTWVDQLALYANINKAKGKLESYKLDDIGKKEIGEEKDSYEGNIKTLHLDNYFTFILYNIQDTMMLMMIEEKINHLDLLYRVTTMTATRTTHALKKTVCLRNLAAQFYHDKGYIISNNRSRLFPKLDHKIAGASNTGAR